tara:strand:+ start:1047 stop:1514 length:468 start_codon:yes stop_codon:yes gene_type:complete
MAHFAKLDENNIVLQVVVIGDGVSTSDGPLGENDMHPDGETYTANLLGGRWKQTSYNNNFRKEYAGIGSYYDEEKDIFIRPQPFPSWSLDSNSDWQPPVARPEGEHTKYTNSEGVEEPYAEIYWSEESGTWLAETHDTPATKYAWNSDTSTYTAL